MCMPIKDEKEPCYLHDECVKGSMCFYYSPKDFHGYCTPIFSRDVRQLAMPLIEKVPANQDDMEKLCRSGYLNKTTGRCGRELKSLNKGVACTTDRDCPTTDSLVFT